MRTITPTEKQDDTAAPGAPAPAPGSSSCSGGSSGSVKRFLLPRGRRGRQAPSIIVLLLFLLLELMLLLVHVPGVASYGSFLQNEMDKDEPDDDDNSRFLQEMNTTTDTNTNTNTTQTGPPFGEFCTATNTAAASGNNSGTTTTIHNNNTSTTTSETTTTQTIETFHTLLIITFPGNYSLVTIENIHLFATTFGTIYNNRMKMMRMLEQQQEQEIIVNMTTTSNNTTTNITSSSSDTTSSTNTTTTTILSNSSTTTTSTGGTSICDPLFRTIQSIQATSNVSLPGHSSNNYYTTDANINTEWAGGRIGGGMEDNPMNPVRRRVAKRRTRTRQGITVSEVSSSTSSSSSDLHQEKEEEEESTSSSFFFMKKDILLESIFESSHHLWESTTTTSSSKGSEEEEEQQEQHPIRQLQELEQSNGLGTTNMTITTNSSTTNMTMISPTLSPTSSSSQQDDDSTTSNTIADTTRTVNYDLIYILLDIEGSCRGCREQFQTGGSIGNTLNLFDDITESTTTSTTATSTTTGPPPLPQVRRQRQRERQLLLRGGGGGGGGTKEKQEQPRQLQQEQELPFVQEDEEEDVVIQDDGYQCTCPINSMVVVPDSEMFQTALTTEMKELNENGELDFGNSFDTTNTTNTTNTTDLSIEIVSIPVMELPCTTEEQFFSTVYFMTGITFDPSLLTYDTTTTTTTIQEGGEEEEEDVPILQQIETLFLESYNGIALQLCDSLFRTIDNVEYISYTVEDDTTNTNNDNNSNTNEGEQAGTSTSTFPTNTITIEFVVDATCRGIGCNDPGCLFESNDSAGICQAGGQEEPQQRERQRRRRRADEEMIETIATSSTEERMILDTSSNRFGSNMNHSPSPPRPLGRHLQQQEQPQQDFVLVEVGTAERCVCIEDRPVRPPTEEEVRDLLQLGLDRIMARYSRSLCLVDGNGQVPNTCSCQNDLNCISGYCDELSGSCQPPPPTASPTSPPSDAQVCSPCNDGSDCPLSGICIGSICAEVDGFLDHTCPCLDHESCRSGRCKDLGLICETVCTTTDDESGVGVDSSCEEICFGICTEKIQDTCTETCITSRDCESGNCGTMVCLPDGDGNGGAMAVGLLPDGCFSALGSECQSGQSENNLCVSPPLTLAPTPLDVTTSAPTIQATTSQPITNPPTITDQTNMPTTQPSSSPSTKLTSQPTQFPTPLPTAGPTPSPTPLPTSGPTPSPTSLPTAGPTPSPTPLPTPGPTASPTISPSGRPTASPTISPSGRPTTSPTISPSGRPTPSPTPGPTEEPTIEPTPQPTPEPTPQPTPQPTLQPTPQPSSQPTSQPTSQPSFQPTSQPTLQPTPQPTSQPTFPINPGCLSGNEAEDNEQYCACTQQQIADVRCGGFSVGFFWSGCFCLDDTASTVQAQCPGYYLVLDELNDSDREAFLECCQFTEFWGGSCEGYLAP